MTQPTAYPRAQVAIEFRQDIRDAYDAIASYPDRFKVMFWESLDNDPKIPASMLSESVEAAYLEWKTPYDTAALNEALERIRKLGDGAEKRFKEVIELLGETVDIEHTVTQIEEEFKDKPLDYSMINKIKTAMYESYGVRTLPGLLKALGVKTQSVGGEEQYFVDGHWTPSWEKALYAHYRDNKSLYKLDVDDSALESELSPLPLPPRGTTPSLGAQSLAAKKDDPTPSLTGSPPVQDASSPTSLTESIPKPSKGKYIGAWLVWGIVGSVMSFILGLIIAGAAQSARSMDDLMNLLAVAGVLDGGAVYVAFLLVYLGMFKSLILNKVLPWIYTLGTFGTLMGIGRINADLIMGFGREANLDGKVLVSYLGTWVVVCLLIRMHAKNQAERREAVNRH